MANLDNIVDVFAGATFNNASDGNLVVPSGQIPRMSQGDNVAEGAVEGAVDLAEKAFSEVSDVSKKLTTVPLGS